MPMVHRSLEVDMPQAAPYETHAFLDTFAGEFILPIQDKLARFWFSRYVNAAGRRHILFRFSTERYDEVKKDLATAALTFRDTGYKEGGYDYVNDLGRGENDRFLGDARDRDPEKRAELVYDFLTAGARLYLSCLVKETDGHWRLEQETRSGHNVETSLESVHHLFCNMTNVPTFVRLFVAPGNEVAAAGLPVLMQFTTQLAGGPADIHQILVQSRLYGSWTSHDHPNWQWADAKVWH